LKGVTSQFGWVSALGILVRTGQYQSAAIVTNAVFPLLFLSTTFLPGELITSKWLLTVSWGNPVTYIPEGIWYVLTGTTSAMFFYTGVLIFSITALLSIIFAIASSNKMKLK